jgi:hypothetical protein
MHKICVFAREFHIKTLLYSFSLENRMFEDVVVVVF